MFIQYIAIESKAFQKVRFAASLPLGAKAANSDKNALLATFENHVRRDLAYYVNAARDAAPSRTWPIGQARKVMALSG